MPDRRGFAQARRRSGGPDERYAEDPRPRPARVPRPRLRAAARRPARVRRPVRRLLGLPRAAARGGVAAARRRRHAVPAPRLPRGALREGAARRPVRARPVPQRADLGVRLRREDPQALADQARHDPRLREGSGALLVRLRGGRPRAVHGAGPRDAREGRARQAPHRRLVAHDRADDRSREDGVSDAEARRASCAGSSRRRAGPAIACSTSSPAAARRVPSHRRSGATRCSSTTIPRRSR